jgi:hypothetical protein
MEAKLSFETSVPTRPTRPHIPEGAILPRHRRETPKSYIRFSKACVMQNQEHCRQHKVGYALLFSAGGTYRRAEDSLLIVQYNVEFQS